MKSAAHSSMAQSGTDGAALSEPFFERDVDLVARDLLGASLFVHGVGGMIVETEAYDADDPASHSFGGRSDRNAAMFGPAGHAYVYRIYGLHWCLNMVTSAGETGSAVLIRAIQPLQGLNLMRQRRGRVTERRLCSGPGRLTQALDVDGTLDGLRLDRLPFSLVARHQTPEIAVGRRIGISKASERARRFCVAGSEFLSRPIE